MHTVWHNKNSNHSCHDSGGFDKSQTLFSFLSWILNTRNIESLSAMKMEWDNKFKTLIVKTIENFSLNLPAILVNSIPKIKLFPVSIFYNTELSHFWTTYCK